MKPKKYTVAWEEKYPAFITDIFALAIVECPRIIGNDIIEYYSFIENNGLGITFYSEAAQRKIEREHGRYFLRKERADKMISNYDKIILEHNRFFDKFKKLNLSKMSDKKLFDAWIAYKKLIFKVGANFRASRPECEDRITNCIMKILVKSYNKEEVDEKFRIIASAHKASLIEKEKNDWIKILKSNADIYKLKELFLSHVNKYPSFFVNIYNIDTILKLLNDKYNKDKKNIKKLEKEQEERKKAVKLLKKDQSQIYRKCEDKKLKIYSQILQEFGWYRLELKNLWAGAEVKFMPLFNEISRRFNVQINDLLDFYSIKDFKNLFKNKKKLSKKEINNRKKCLSIIVEFGKYKILSGNRAMKMLDYMKKNLVYDKEIKGQIAFKGKAVGRVKIIIPDSCTDKKINNGEILVTTNSQPSMAQIMSMAGAFITDIGGITSHAAIMAREMRKPCVIGTGNATKMLQDGDLVEVDADNGIVKIVE